MGLASLFQNKVQGLDDNQANGWLRSILGFFGLGKYADTVSDFFDGPKNVFSMLVASFFGVSQPPPSTVLDTGAGADGTNPKTGGTDTDPKAGSQTVSAASQTADLGNQDATSASKISSLSGDFNNAAIQEIAQEFGVDIKLVTAAFIKASGLKASGPKDPTKAKSDLAQEFANTHDGIEAEDSDDIFNAVFAELEQQQQQQEQEQEQQQRRDQIVMGR